MVNVEDWRRKDITFSKICHIKKKRNYMVYLIVWLLMGFLGYKMGEKKKMGSTVGAVLGFLLGLIGLVIIYFSKDEEVSQ